MKMIATATILLALTGTTQAAAACEVSLPQYRALTTGMTYSKAKTVLGCDGTEWMETKAGV
jgi:hypothetical protein